MRDLFTNTNKYIVKGYQQSYFDANEGHVYTFANMISTAVALTTVRLYIKKRGKTTSTKALNDKQVKWLFSERSGVKNILKSVMPEDVEEVTDHPIIALLDRPNKNDKTGFNLRQRTEYHQLLSGNGYQWMPHLQNREPVAIHLLSSANVKIETDDKEEYHKVVKYKETINGKLKEYEPEEIIHFKYAATDWLYGLSPLEAAMKYINLDHSLLMLLMDIAGNRLGMELFLKAVSEMGGKTVKNYTEEQKKAVKQMFSDFRTGNIKSNEVPFLDADLSLEQIPNSNKDLPFTDNMKLFREFIAGVFGIPLSMLTQESSNRAVANTGKTQFAEYTILPKLIRYCDSITVSLLPMFKGTEGMFFAADDPVPDNFEMEANVYSKLVGAGILSPDEARLEFDYESMDGGDMLYMPSTMTPITQVGQTPQQQGEDFAKGVKKGLEE
jgi:HK97 family phage portal protein